VIKIHDFQITEEQNMKEVIKKIHNIQIMARTKHEGGDALLLFGKKNLFIYGK
jgi:hypothetical protein